LVDGDVVRVCAETGMLEALVDPAEWSARALAAAAPEDMGVGRELFALMRRYTDPAERGGSAMLAAAGL
jgi:phosphogluconate dehydratase